MERRCGIAALTCVGRIALTLLAAALCGSLPAQNSDKTARLLALFNSHPKADIAVELIKKYEGMHDRSDYPYYGYGHRRLPNENLSYDMTEEEAEALLRKDLAVRYKLFRKFGKGIARSRRTPEKQARPQAGSREPGHLQGIHILPLLERQTRPLDRAAAQNGVPAAV